MCISELRVPLERGLQTGGQESRPVFRAKGSRACGGVERGEHVPGPWGHVDAVVTGGAGR